MGFCKRKCVECECITEHSVCNTDNCHRKLPDTIEEALLTYQLLEIATELDAREATNNCIIHDLQGVGWKELCDRGIEILKKLREI